jgi:hypothetical protein
VRDSYALLVTISCVLVSAGTAEAQDWHYYTAMPGSCQHAEGKAQSGDGTIGATFVQDSSCSPTSVVITSVQPAGPAANAGIQVGDTLFRTTQQGSDVYTVPLIACALDDEIRASAGQQVSLYRLPANSSLLQPLTLQVKRRSDVYPAESSEPSSISELVELGNRGLAQTKETRTVDGKTVFYQECAAPKRVYIAITQVSQRAQLPIHVEIVLSNQTGTLLNEGKFFLLDANQRQIPLVTFDERKFQLEQLVYEAQSELRALDDYGRSSTFSLPMPSPPAPPLRYSISATTDGSYSVSEAGSNAVSLSGTSTTTFTTTPEFDSSRSVAYLADSVTYWIARRRQEKWNREMQAKWAELREQVEGSARQSNQLLENWDRIGFRLNRPLVPDETRSGFVLFSPSQTNYNSDLKLVIVLADPETQKDQFVTFRFRR